MEVKITSYKGIDFRSRLEARWAVFFDSLELDWEYEPEGYVLSNNMSYLPDFKVKGVYGFDELYVEVKGVLSESDVSKISKFEKPLLVVGNIPNPNNMLEDIVEKYNSNQEIWYSRKTIDNVSDVIFFAIHPDNNRVYLLPISKMSKERRCISACQAAINKKWEYIKNESNSPKVATVANTGKFVYEVFIADLPTLESMKEQYKRQHDEEAVSAIESAIVRKQEIQKRNEEYKIRRAEEEARKQRSREEYRASFEMTTTTKVFNLFMSYPEIKALENEVKIELIEPDVEIPVKSHILHTDFPFKEIDQHSGHIIFSDFQDYTYEKGFSVKANIISIETAVGNWMKDRDVAKRKDSNERIFSKALNKLVKDFPNINSLL